MRQSKQGHCHLRKAASYTSPNQLKIQIEIRGEHAQREPLYLLTCAQVYLTSMVWATSYAIYILSHVF